MSSKEIAYIYIYIDLRACIMYVRVDRVHDCRLLHELHACMYSSPGLYACMRKFYFLRVSDRRTEFLP